ncbi:hypothetical protein [Methyloceanibacter sp.]|uniref:hypothetical protein n=1 Tax=Methyloceanibacter sp. TaxID=1965321 RepID=UPI002CE8C804|nr:hypothetical protein [Methyloceanibacter sp.]HML91232.1 hypothetical protein [Methyloceanibacter sp.]
MPKTKNGARGCAPKNRYCIGAKLSEHKFLRLLRGLADNMPVHELEPRTHISGKTIRSTYRALRAELASAVRAEPERFGGTGTVLFADGQLTECGREILRRVYRSREFRLYRKHHAPRLKDEFDERNLLVNKAVRMFCVVALPPAGLEADASNVINTLQLLEAIDFDLPLLRRFVEGRLPVDQPDGTANGCSNEFLDAARDVPRHHYPERRLYEDFRRYLLKNPLGRDPEP